MTQTESGTRSTDSTAALALAVALGLAIVAFALRMFDAGDKSIWLDEAWSWRAANLSFGDMVDWTAEDRHPPLYYAILHVFVDVFGDAEAALRLPSALASAASVSLLAWLGWRAGGWSVGLLAGGLLALHPTHIEFAQEARMYPVMGLIALVATIALASMISRPSIPRAVAYAALATAMLYTHYSAILVIGLHTALVCAFAAYRWREDGRSIAMFGFAALLGAVLAFAPWYGNFLESAREGVGHLPEPSWRLADLVFSSLFGLQRAEDLWLAVALPLIAFGLYGVAKRIRDPYVACVAAIALLPLAQFAISWLRSPVLDARQASPYITGYAFIAAIGLIEAGQYIADVFGRKSVVVPVAVAGGVVIGGLMFVATMDWYRSGPREDWRAAARIVDERGGITLLWRAYVDVPLQYYTNAPTLPSPPNELPREGAASTLILSHHSRDDATAITGGLSGLYVVEEPLVLPGITVHGLTRRAQ